MLNRNLISLARRGAAILALAALSVGTALRASGPPKGDDQNLAKAKFTTVVIDPGHGGYDPGAQRNDLREADITLKVAKRLRAKLKKAGIPVVMTRDTDVYIDLDGRIKIANQADDAILVSIHVNAAANRAVAGTEIYRFNDASAELSNAMAGGIKNLQSRFRGASRKPLTLLTGCTCRAILVEGGFITNPGDLGVISDAKFPLNYADALARGILDYRNK